MSLARYAYYASQATSLLLIAEGLTGFLSPLTISNQLFRLPCKDLHEARFIPMITVRNLGLGIASLLFGEGRNLIGMDAASGRMAIKVLLGLGAGMAGVDGWVVRRFGRGRGEEWAHWRVGGIVAVLAWAM